MCARQASAGRARNQRHAVHHQGHGRRARSRRVAGRHEDRVLAAPAARSQLKNTDPKQPNWKIYQYDAARQDVTQLTNDDITSGHDVGAHYLPDGRIVFASTRQLATQAILLDEGRPQYQAVTRQSSSRPSFCLHVMNARRHRHASDQLQHQPRFRALGAGERPDRVFALGSDQRHRIRSACTSQSGRHGLELYYGANSHATGANIAGTNNNVIQFLNARQRADGKLIAIVGLSWGPSSAAISAHRCGKLRRDQSSRAHAHPRHAGPGQTSATTLGVTTDANMPSAGRTVRTRSISALRRHQPDVGELGAVPDPQCRRIHGGLQQRQHHRRQRATAPPPSTRIWIYDFDAPEP
jgi:hypothetical protein